MAPFKKDKMDRGRWTTGIKGSFVCFSQDNEAFLDKLLIHILASIHVQGCSHLKRSRGHAPTTQIPWANFEDYSINLYIVKHFDRMNNLLENRKSVNSFSFQFVIE